MKNLIALILLLFTTMALATSTPTKFTTDVVQFGHSGSTANHSLVYDFGLGASNPSATIDNSTHTWNYNYNLMEFGDGTTGSDKKITANIGGSNPVIAYSISNAQWQFSNDGTNFNAFGSGSGGGGSGINLLANPGFESGSSLWTNSGLTVAVVSSPSANLLFDKHSVTLVATAGAQFFEQSVTIPNGLGGTNCAVSVWYKGGDPNLVLHFTDNSNVDLGPAYPLVATTIPQQVFLNGICPAGGSNAKIRFVSLSSTSLTSIDNATLGNASNLSQVSQGQFIGKLIQYNCNTAGETSTTANIWSPFTGVTSCSYVASGLTQPGTAVPGFILSGGAGIYKITVNGAIYNQGAHTGQGGAIRISDGVNNSNADMLVGAGASSSEALGTYVFFINETTSFSNLTFQLQGVSYDGTNATAIQNSATGTTSDALSAPINEFDVEMVPSQSQIAVSSTMGPSVTDWVQYTPTITGFGTPTNVSFQSRRSGDSLEVQGYFTSGTSTVTLAKVSLGYAGVNSNVSIDNTKFTNSQSLVGVGLSNANGTNTFSFLATGAVSYLEMSVQNGSNPGLVPANASTLLSAGQDVSFFVRVPIQGWTSPTMMAPILVGSVTSSSPGAEALHRIAFGDAFNSSCTSSPCGYTNQDGAWATSVTRAGAGTYTVNFATPFAGPPVCTCSAQQAFGSGDITCSIPNALSGSVSINTVQAGTSGDTFVNVICMGPR